MDISRFLDGDVDTDRRRFLGGLATVGAGALAGCTGGTDDSAPQTTRTTTDTTTAAQTTTKPTTTPETTTTKDRVTVEDVRETRASLTEGEKREHYRSGIPSVDDYELDYDRVQSENDTRREQLIDITETVGDQYVDWVEGNHAVMNAIHNLDWMGWDQDNILNIVTRYNSRPGEDVTVNYSTEDGGRNLDGMFAADSGSGEETYIENIPDSQITSGSGGNFLTMDVESIQDVIQGADSLGEDDWEMLHMTMQSVVPGIKGPSIHDDRAQDRNIIFDEEAIRYLSENYNDSAESVNEVTDEALEIGMSTVQVRSSGRYVGVTAGEDGLEVDSVYSQEEGREKMKEPVDL